MGMCTYVYVSVTDSARAIVRYAHICSFSNSIPQDNGSPKEHAQYVWKQFVKNAKAKKIYIVAHSFGGVVTVDLVSLCLCMLTIFMYLPCQAATKFDEFKKRVHKIAFTDSVHSLQSQDTPRKVRKWLIEVCHMHDDVMVSNGYITDRMRRIGCQVTVHWIQNWTPLLKMLREFLLVCSYSQIWSTASIVLSSQHTGTQKHVETSWMSFNSIFSFFSKS